MKKTFLYMWAAALLMVLPACEENPVDEPGGNGGENTPSEYVWHFGVENADATQSIGLFVREYEGSLTNGEIRPDAITGASFSLKTDYPLSTGGKVYAYSPYDAAAADLKAIPFVIPLVQKAGSVAMPKAAEPVVLSEPESENTATLAFVDLASTLNVKVYASQSVEETITEIAFKADTPIAGVFKFNVKGMNPNQASTMAISGYTDKEVLVSGSVPVASDAASASGLSMIVAPGTYSGTFTVTTDKDSYGIVLEDPVVLERGESATVTLCIAPKSGVDAGGSTEDFEGGDLDTGEPEETNDGSISILAIGNSFSIDGMQYLYNVLAKLGYTDIHLGNLYISGCTLETHAGNITGNKAAYTYYTNSTGDWVKTTDYSSITALKSRKWDYITVQQASKHSGKPDTYEPYLTTVMNEVKTDCPKARRGWHMTWAYKGDYSSTNFAIYGNNQMTMYNAIVSTVQSTILTRSDIDFVIPVGTAIQNLRTSFIGDHLSRNDTNPVPSGSESDGTHLSYDLGRLTAAMMWARQITGKSVMGIKYVPTGYTVSDEQFLAIWDAVEKAYQKPYEVTVSAYPGSTPPDPGPGTDPDPVTGTLPSDELKAIFTGAGYSLSDYEAVPIQWTHFAYWNTVNNGSVLQTQSNQTSNNLKKFSATQMFSKTDLPVGSVIVCKDGYQYRPDAMVSLSEKTASASRRANVTVSGSNSVVVADATWWGDKGVAWNYVGFNLAKNGVSILDEAGHKELEGVFAIFKPKQ